MVFCVNICERIANNYFSDFLFHVCVFFVNYVVVKFDAILATILEITTIDVQYVFIHLIAMFGVWFLVFLGCVL